MHLFYSPRHYLSNPIKPKIYIAASGNAASSGGANWLYTDYIYDEYPLNASSFFKSIKHTASFCLLSALYYVEYWLWRDKNNRLKFDVRKKKDTITIDKFKVKVMDIVLIKSDENYIFLYCLEG